MKLTIRFALALLVAMSVAMGGASFAETPETAQIILYGERHGEQMILDKELALWQGYYDGGLRDLFVEFPYYTAALLNQWMQAEDDAILEALYADWEGTAAHVPATLDFYQRLKAACPETVFHGVDVGHQHDTTGARYLAQLAGAGQADSEAYRLAQQAVDQGEYYYANEDHAYREITMAKNFMQAYDALGGGRVVGFFGRAHVGLEAMDYHTGTVYTMAGQLREHYGDIVYGEDLYWVTKDIAPVRVDTIDVGGKAYEASYYGAQDLGGFRGFASRAFWRLEGAYEDMKDLPKPGDVLPYDNYPMRIEVGEVYVIDYTKEDGEVMRMYYRADGALWQGQETTEQIAVE